MAGGRMNMGEAVKVGIGSVSEVPVQSITISHFNGKMMMVTRQINPTSSSIEFDDESILIYKGDIPINAPGKRVVESEFTDSKVTIRFTDGSFFEFNPTDAIIKLSAGG